MAGYTLIFDTETTDLIKNSLMPINNQPHIIEFYGELVTDEGEVIEELEFLCNPGIKIPDESVKITGITDEDVRDKPRFSHFSPQVIELLSKSRAVVAHNLAYDWEVLATEFKRINLTESVPWPKVRICTVQETEWMKGYRLSLSALHEELFGEPFSGAHRAKVDVKALTRCFVELKKREVL